MLRSFETILYIFLLLYFLIIIYDVASLYNKKNESKNNEQKQKKLINLIIKHKNNEKDLININQTLINKLCKLSYLASLGSLLENNIVIKELDNMHIKDILNDGSFDNIFAKLSIIYNKKESLEKAYFAHILCYVHPSSPEITKFLYSCISSTSIYARENALQALYSTGNVEMICHAYKIISKENIYYNHKLISDGIINFTGEKKKLGSALYENFNQFNDETKIGILTYFRNIKFDIKEEILNCLENKKLEKEVEIAMIRYFSKVPYDKAYELFVNRLEQKYYNDFDYEIVMIQALKRAENLPRKAIEVLISKLSNPNYYVRYNAAKTLKDKIDLRKLENINDIYAKDMIEYCLEGEV